MDQKSEIIKHLRRGVVLTPYFAFTKIGCSKLSTRIGEIIKYELLNKNETIVRKMERTKEKRFMTYKLKKVK